MSFVARYTSGKCTECQKSLERGQILAAVPAKKGYRHQVCPGQAGVDRPWQIEDNPWYHIHLEGEMNFLGEGYTRSIARQLVRGEFLGMEEPIPCAGCGAHAFWKATVGTYICPQCNAQRLRDDNWTRHIGGGKFEEVK
jgi:ribosomal protein L37AE/L43A